MVSIFHVRTFSEIVVKFKFKWGIDVEQQGYTRNIWSDKNNFYVTTWFDGDLFEVLLKAKPYPKYRFYWVWDLLPELDY